MMCGLLYDATGKRKTWIGSDWSKVSREISEVGSLFEFISIKLARLVCRKLPFCFFYSNSLPFTIPQFAHRQKKKHGKKKKKNVCRVAKKSAWWRVIRAMTRTLLRQRFAHRVLQSRYFPWAVRIVNDFIMPILGLFLCFVQFLFIFMFFVFFFLNSKLLSATNDNDNNCGCCLKTYLIKLHSSLLWLFVD